MSTQASYSKRNVWNTLGVALADRLLAKGYLVYWHEQDGVQTPDGYYGEYSGRQDLLLADPTFAARVAAAKGLATLRGPVTANPRFVTRPTVSGAIDGQDEVPVPAFAVEVGSPHPVGNYEIGSHLKWRRRHLLVHAFGRTEAERSDFEDWLAEWFDGDVMIDVLDHDAGTLDVVGPVRVVRPMVEGDIQVEGPEATTYAVELNASLEYVA